MRFQVIGMRGDADPGSIIGHFQSMGGDCILLDPDAVCGKGHVLSAAVHGERAFAEGTNRSRSLLTEIILYIAWDRQIGRAVEKVSPKPGRNEYVALLVDVDDPALGAIGMERDDSLADADEKRAEELGLADRLLPPEDRALEMVALLELQKSRRPGRGPEGPRGRPRTSVSMELPAGEFLTTILLSICDFSASTWEIIPIRTFPSPICSRTDIACFRASGSRDPNPSSTNRVSILIPPLLLCTASDSPSARDRAARKDSPPERVLDALMRPV